MRATINYQQLNFSNLIPRGWQPVHIPGTIVKAWQNASDSLLIEHVQIDTIDLQLIRAFFTRQQHLELLLSTQHPVFCLGMSGNWEFRNGAVLQTHISSNQFTLQNNKLIRIIGDNRPCKMLQLLLIHYPVAVWEQTHKLQKNETAIFTTNNNAQYATATISELAEQLVQTSYFPKPQLFHKKIVNELLANIQQLNLSNTFIKGYTENERIVLEKIATQIHQQLHRHFTITALASNSGLNRVRLTQGFKQLYGTTLYRYLLSKRMELALHLLQNTNATIKQIAGKTGYRNTSNFSIAFKKFYRFTPATARQGKL